MNLSMFDISNSLIIGELNVIFTLERDRTGNTHRLHMGSIDDGALCKVCAGTQLHKSANNSSWMQKRANQGALLYGFGELCLEPECITYEGRGYMSFLWRA